MKLKSKLFAGVLGAAMVLSTVGIPASAQTTAELTAQINSLLAMIAQLQAQIAGTTPTTGVGMTFTSDLTIGSTGAEVSALQQWLVSQGYLAMPAGVAYGYFGPLTQSALAKYQAEAGISPAAGYFGPITRARLNAMAGTTPTVPGTTPTTPGAGITTPGVEGTLTVTSNNSGLVSTVYEGDSRAPILGMRLEARTSDIAVQRIKLDLGNSTTIYNKIYSRLYVMDGSNILASVDLNSSTVVREGNDYFVTIAGFTYVVPKNTTRQLVIAADVYNTVDTTDVGNSPYTVRLANNGVRGVDGAGIDQYSPSTGSSVSRSVAVAKSLSDAAAIKMSLNNASPKLSEVVASAGTSNNELDNLTVLVFDVKAEKDNVEINDMQVAVAINSDTTPSLVQTVRLFDGSTEIDNASLVSGIAMFNNIDLSISKDSTKTFTVKVDVRNADGTLRTITASASSTGIWAENSKGDTLTSGNKTGSATGRAIGIRNVGAEVSLVSKSITTAQAPQSSTANNFSTSTLTATFNVKIKAVGGDLALGTVASTSGRVFNPSTSFVLYRNGVVSTANVATSTAFTIPNCTSVGSDTCLLSEGSEATIQVSFVIPGRNTASGALDSGIYSVGLERVQWSANNGGTVSASTFMAGEVDWRTSDVSFP
jgi:hypothetical protein